MKESAKEMRQIRAKRLGGAESNLRYALRQARRDLSLDGELSPDARLLLEEEGVLYGGLVPDMDGDAPDRFDDSKPIDWKWVSKRGRGSQRKAARHGRRSRRTDQLSQALQ